jgi:hypothetical protein
VGAEARTVVVTVSGKDSLLHCRRVLSKPAKRLAVAGGLVLAGWALGAVLSTTASADELPPGFDGQDTVSASGTTQTEAAADTTQSDTGQTSKQKAKSSSSSGLLSGLIGGLVDTVGDTLTTTVNTVHSTVDTVSETVGGVVDTVDQTIIGPITGGGSLTQLTKPLLNGLVSDGGSVDGGGTVTNTVAVSTTPVAEAAAPAAATSAPETPRPTAPSTTNYEPSTTPTHAAGPQLAPKRQAAAVEQPPTESGKRIGLPGSGGGSGGGGGLPAAPSSPVAPTTVTAGHDGSGGARQQNAILGSSATTTQLRLMGTSLDREADGAGRDAALPTTSPD